MMTLESACDGEQPLGASQAKLADIRTLLTESSRADPDQLLQKIGRIIARDRPAAGEVYQKPWG